MDQSILVSGMWLTVYGMGTVFVFLSVLIVATRIMSRFAMERLVTSQASQLPRTDARTAEAPPRDEELVAVIAAAIRCYRSARDSTR